MKKFIVIMLLALVSAVTTKAQNSSIQWASFQKEIPLSNQDLISVFKTSDALQGKTCQIAGTNIIYKYNIRPSVARSVTINNLVGMGFPIKEGNIEEFIRDYCYIAPWPLGKSSYKTANYFLDPKGNPVANGYTYNGGAGVWALWIKEYNIPILKINCMQAQACNFRLPMQVPATPVAKEKQVVQPVNVYPVNYASAPAPQRKSASFVYEQTKSKGASTSLSLAGGGGSLSRCFSSALNGDFVESAANLIGAVSIHREGASEERTYYAGESTGIDSQFPNMNQNNQNNQNNYNDNNGCNTGSYATTWQGTLNNPQKPSWMY